MAGMYRGLFHIATLVIKLTVFAAILLGAAPNRAEAQQFNHQLMRRLAVFPMRAERGFDAIAEDAWWQVREELTRSRRFLVASKQFLVKSDVFQPRGDLEPADSIILGKLLDAHALITMQLFDRKLTMSVFDGGNGVLLWKKTMPLHPSIAVGDQLAAVAKKLVNNFVAEIPYQGFTIIDSMVGQAVYQEGDMKLAHIDLGGATGAQIGDVVQWVRIGSTNAAPMFQGGAQTKVFAEGKIVRIEQGTAIVEVARASSLKDIREYSLVRVPREADRLVAEYAGNGGLKATLPAELVSPEASPMEQVARERRPLATALSFVGSIAAFLLLVF